MFANVKADEEGCLRLRINRRGLHRPVQETSPSLSQSLSSKPRGSNDQRARPHGSTTVGTDEGSPRSTITPTSPKVPFGSGPCHPLFLRTHPGHHQSIFQAVSFNCFFFCCSAFLAAAAAALSFSSILLPQTPLSQDLTMSSPLTLVIKPALMHSIRASMCQILSGG